MPRFIPKRDYDDLKKRLSQRRKVPLALKSATLSRAMTEKKQAAYFKSMSKDKNVILAPSAKALIKKYSKGTRQIKARTPWTSGAGTPGQTKAIDINVNTYVFQPTGNPYLLNGIQEGYSFYQRVGRKIALLSVEFEGGLIANANTNYTDSGIRLLVVYDKSPNGALPSYNDIFSSWTGANPAVQSNHDWQAPLNISNKDRFKLLYEKAFSTQSYYDPTHGEVQTVGGMCSSNHAVTRIYIRLPKLECQFKDAGGTSTTITSVATGALFALWVSEINGNNFSIEGSWRVRFQDN